MIVFLDTETTGTLKKELPIGHKDQPHIVQVGLVFASSLDDMKKYSFLIKPNGWQHSLEASAIHGVTDDDTSRYGMLLPEVFGLVDMLIEKHGAQGVVCHNIGYDLGMVKREAEAENGVNCAIRNLPRFCTMISNTALMGSRWPKLIALYKHFFGREFEGAHDALQDCTATAEIFFEMQKREMKTEFYFKS